VVVSVANHEAHQPGSIVERHSLGLTALEWSDYWFDLADRPGSQPVFSAAKCERNGILWLAHHCGALPAPGYTQLSPEVV
jgi:hypothetical protein